MAGGKWTELIAQRHNNPMVTPRSTDDAHDLTRRKHAAWDSVGVSEDPTRSRCLPRVSRVFLLSMS